MIRRPFQTFRSGRLHRNICLRPPKRSRRPWLNQCSTPIPRPSPPPPFVRHSSACIDACVYLGRPDVPEGAGAGVLHGEQLPVPEAAEDGPVRRRLRDELLPGAQDQKAEGAVDLQRRHAVHQGRGNRAEVRVREEMLLTTRPLHGKSSAVTTTTATTTTATTATATTTTTTGRRRPAARPVNPR